MRSRDSEAPESTDPLDVIAEVIRNARLLKKKSALKPKQAQVTATEIEPEEAKEPELAEETMGEDPDEEELEKLKKMLSGG